MENTDVHPESIRTGSGTGSGLDHEIEGIHGSGCGKTMEIRQMGHGVLQSVNCAVQSIKEIT